MHISITSCSLNIYSPLLPSVLTNDRPGLEYKTFSRTNRVSLQQAAQASWSFRRCAAAWWRPLWIRLWQLLFMFRWARELLKNNVCIMYKMHRRVRQKWDTLRWKDLTSKVKIKTRTQVYSTPLFTTYAKRWRSSAEPFHAAAIYWPSDMFQS